MEDMTLLTQIRTSWFPTNHTLDEKKTVGGDAGGDVRDLQGEYSTTEGPFFRKQVPTGSRSETPKVDHWYRGAQACDTDSCHLSTMLLDISSANSRPHDENIHIQFRHHILISKCRKRSGSCDNNVPFSVTPARSGSHHDVFSVRSHRSAKPLLGFELHSNSVCVGPVACTDRQPLMTI